MARYIVVVRETHTYEISADSIDLALELVLDGSGEEVATKHTKNEFVSYYETATNQDGPMIPLAPEQIQRLLDEGVV